MEATRSESKVDSDGFKNQKESMQFTITHRLTFS